MVVPTFSRSIRRSGSALLLTVVAMAAIAMVLAVGSSALLTGTRTRSYSDGSRIAQLDAEGKLRQALATAGLGYNFWTLNGVTDENDASRRSAFKTDRGAVRNLVTINEGGRANTSGEGYTFTTRELPHNTAVWLGIEGLDMRSSLQFSLQNGISDATRFFNDFSYQFCTSTNGVEDCENPRWASISVPNQVSIADLVGTDPQNFTFTGVRLKLNYRLDQSGNPYARDHVPALKVVVNQINPSAAGGRDIVKISKGFTTVYVTGADGGSNGTGAERAYLAILRPFDRTEPSVTTAQPHYSLQPAGEVLNDQTGFCTNSKALWKVSSTTVYQEYDPNKYNPATRQYNAQPYNINAFTWLGRDNCR